MRTKQDILSNMREEMPYELHPKIDNYILEAMEIYANEKLAFSKIQNIESEIVVSDSPDVKHGALHGVRNLECEADQSDSLENTNGATLETRIDSESFQYQCKETIIGCKNWCGKTICMVFKAKERKFLTESE